MDDLMFQVTSVISSHWHGISQNGSNYADGTSFVTQCPITLNHSFLHSFSTQNQAGTFWYHSHYSCDGLRGALVIYDPQDPLAYMYDVNDASTVITLANWYHIIAPILHQMIPVAQSILINGLGCHVGGPKSNLAVINVEQGKRYRLHLVQMSCGSNVLFSINGHDLSVIEADGVLTEPLVVDQLQIFVGQCYSVVLVANQPVDNYWVCGVPNSDKTHHGSAILHYKGTPEFTDAEAKEVRAGIMGQLNLSCLCGGQLTHVDCGVMSVLYSFKGGVYYIHKGVHHHPKQTHILHLSRDELARFEQNVFENPDAGPAALIAGRHSLTALPVEEEIHSFSVVQTVGSSTFNYINPVRRDVVDSGSDGQQMVIRWVTDNSGPWILHCTLKPVLLW
ncbi:multicopper oxidase-domain-containing protein [Suillus subluteus]|nr:multicopper oxidase-domain-containing protein [Suillus subluteus]